MFNKEIYENLPIVEQFKIYSKTEPGEVFVCTRRGSTLPIYKWGNYYFLITPTTPQDTEELRKSNLYGNPSDKELNNLLKFIHSCRLVNTPCEDKIVWDIIKVIWQCAYDALSLEN